MPQRKPWAFGRAVLGGGTTLIHTDPSGRGRQEEREGGRGELSEKGREVQAVLSSAEVGMQFASMEEPVLRRH